MMSSISESNENSTIIANESMGNLDMFPEELVVLFLSHLGARDLGQLSLVCKKMHRITQTMSLWKDRFIFPITCQNDVDVRAEFIKRYCLSKEFTPKIPRFYGLHQAASKTSISALEAIMLRAEDKKFYISSDVFNKLYSEHQNKTICLYLLRRAAEESGEDVAASIKDFCIHDDQVIMVDIAKILARTATNMLCNFIDAFNISEEADRADIAKIAAAHEPITLALMIRTRFNITSQERLIEILTSALNHSDDWGALNMLSWYGIEEQPKKTSYIDLQELIERKKNSLLQTA